MKARAAVVIRPSPPLAATPDTAVFAAVPARRAPARLAPHSAARIVGLAIALGQGIGAQPLQAQSVAPLVDPFEGAPAGPLLRDDVAGARRIPGYAPQGLDIGGVHLVPQVTLRGEGSTNVFNRAAGPRGDTHAEVAPALLASGNLGRATWVLDSRASLARYARLNSYDSETWSLRAQSGVPVTGRITLAVSAAAARRLEPPYEAAGAVGPGGLGGGSGVVLLDQVRGGLGLRGDLGLARITAGVDVARSHYLPLGQSAGPAIVQSFRDDRAISASARIERSLAAGRIVFAEGTHRWIRSLHPGALPDRTATGGEALVGLRGELGHLVMGEVAAGWQWRAYRSPALRDYRGAAWRARVEWYATPLVTLALAGRRDIVNSPLPAAAGVVVDSLSLKALYEARRNLNLILSGTHAVERYRDLPGAPAAAIRSSGVALETQYAANRHLMLGLSARYRDRRSTSPLLPAQGRAAEGGLWLRFTV